MAVYSFSTKNRDDEVIKEVKEFCERTGTSFSHVIISQLRKYRQEVLNNGKADDWTEKNSC